MTTPIEDGGPATENIVDNELSGTVHELPAVLREMADYRIKSNREMRHLLGCEPHEELGVRSLLKAAYVLERQREALESVHRHRGVGLTRQELFDRIGEEFYRQTGMLRPGKDLAAALATSDYRECRDAVWNAWVERKNDEIDAMIERALREMEPE